MRHHHDGLAAIQRASWIIRCRSWQRLSKPVLCLRGEALTKSPLFGPRQRQFAALRVILFSGTGRNGSRALARKIKPIPRREQAT